MVDNLPRWERYSLEELREALEGLDRQRFPERAENLERLIARFDQAQRPPRHDPPFFHQPPDWDRYTLEELEQALEGLDRARYPEREARIRSLIAEKGGGEPE